MLFKNLSGMSTHRFFSLLMTLIAWWLGQSIARSAEIISPAEKKVTITLVQGENNYTGTEDTWISDYYRPPQSPKNLSFGASSELGIFDRKKTGGEIARTLIRFDLAPVRGTITAAKLVLTKSAQSPNGAQFFDQTITLHRITDANRDWQAGTAGHAQENDAAVWQNKADPSIPWIGGPGLVAGKDYFAKPLATARSGSQLGAPVTWTFDDVSFLNDWAKNPEKNAGFMLQEINPPGNACDRFYSSESDKKELRPKLVLTVFPSDTATATATSAYVDISQPPIPIKFSLKESGFVTLVIDDAQGKRVRNLVSDSPFPAGENTAWWDGMDESGKADISPRGYYKIVGKLVTPGSYTVRGIFHKPIDLVHEFAPYNPGNPPWPVPAKSSSGWLADHSPPSTVLFLPKQNGEPQILIGSRVCEGGSSLAWVDLNGKKTRGMGWLGGGNWTGASQLARDVGDHPLPAALAYVGTTVVQGKSKTGADLVELRLLSIGEKENKPVIIHAFPKTENDSIHESLLGGLAARNGLLIATLPSRDQLFIIDASAGKVLKIHMISSPRGVAFDTQGRLLVLAQRELHRYVIPLAAAQITDVALPQAEIFIASGLDDPQNLTLDDAGNIYISDHGNSHNVKVFSADGKLLRAIGKAGVPSVGPYDELRMNHPNGITISSDRHLWVAESDEAPRRVSVWNLDGSFVRAFYGSCRYGGGGVIDPRDQTRYYYGPDGYGMEFQLDWKNGTSQLKQVFLRPSPTDHEPKEGSPETPIYAGNRQYMTNCNNVWLMGANLARLWLLRDGVAVPVAMAGRADAWIGFKNEPFKSLLPKGDDKDENDKNALKDWLFAWSDRNHNGLVEPEEINFLHIPEKLRSWITPVVINENLRMTLGNGYALSPAKIDDDGVPLYDMSRAIAIFEPSETANYRAAKFQAVELGDDWAVQLGGPIYGYHHGQPIWNYPCRWPGLGAMYAEPLDDPKPGQIVGLTRISGSPLKISGSDLGPILPMNANDGTINLITRDGLYVAMLGKENRIGTRITSITDSPRGLSLSNITFGEEHFFLNLNQTADGKIFAVTAFGIVRVDGLESARRLPEQSLNITAEMMANAAAYVVGPGAMPTTKKKLRPLVISSLKKAPEVDGRLDEWNDLPWVTIRPPVNKQTNERRFEASLAIHGEKLFAAYRADDGRLLTSNTGTTLETMFKTGGALDLMIGTDPKADPKRTAPVAGDIRLLVTRVNNRTVAVLYRAVVPGTQTPVPFSSPWRTIYLDRVEDVSDKVTLAAITPPGKMSTIEFSIPLAVLGLKPESGQILRGDIGVLRGDLGTTVERIYWSNKATGLVADVPSEAMLTPQMWGQFQFGQLHDDLLPPR